jgi:hypothetical protein
VVSFFGFLPIKQMEGSVSSLSRYDIVRLLEQTLVAYLFVRIYENYDFSKIDFHDFYQNVFENRVIDSVIEKSRTKGKNAFELKVRELAAILKEECSLFLP